MDRADIGTLAGIIGAAGVGITSIGMGHPMLTDAVEHTLGLDLCLFGGACCGVSLVLLILFFWPKKAALDTPKTPLPNIEDIKVPDVPISPSEAFEAVQDSYIEALKTLIGAEGQNTVGTSRFAELKQRSLKFLDEFSKKPLELESDFSRFHQHGDEMPGWILERLQYTRRNMGFHCWRQPLPDSRTILAQKFIGYTWPGTLSELPLSLHNPTIKSGWIWIGAGLAEGSEGHASNDAGMENQDVTVFTDNEREHIYLFNFGTPFQSENYSTVLLDRSAFHRDVQIGFDFISKTTRSCKLKFYLIPANADGGLKIQFQEGV